MRDRWPLCGCGCGEIVHLPRRKYIKGHRPKVPTRQGYMRVWARDHPLAGPDGNVLEHRKVVFDAGIDVPPGHHVHHKNGDRTDNRLENLEVLPAAEHHRQHIREQGYVVNQYGIWSMHAHGRGGEWVCQ